VCHAVLPANNTIPAFYYHKRSADGTTADYSGKRHIAAYYSFIDPGRMKGQVSLVA